MKYFLSIIIAYFIFSLVLVFRDYSRKHDYASAPGYVNNRPPAHLMFLIILMVPFTRTGISDALRNLQYGRIGFAKALTYFVKPVIFIGVIAFLTYLILFWCWWYIVCHLRGLNRTCDGCVWRTRLRKLTTHCNRPPERHFLGVGLLPVANLRNKGCPA